MKHNLKILTGIILLSSFISCEDDEITKTPNQNPPPVQQPVTLQFNATQYSITENAEGKAVAINLSKPSVSDAIIFVDVSSQHLNNFTTIPQLKYGKIELSIAKGERTASFTVSPINNSTLDGNKTITFKISAAPEGFSIGANKEVITTITDDEGPVQVNFSTNESSANEAFEAGRVISITLSQVAPADGSLEISVTSSGTTYGEHYTTSPQAVAGKITLPIKQGDEKVEIKILPINNTRIGGERKIELEITAATGSVVNGNLVNHTLTIQDDELEGIAKSYSLSGGGWGAKRYYGYREDGQISKIYWERYTPSYTGGTYLYHYNTSAQLTKMIESEFIETYYTWDGGRTTKAEKFNDGVLVQYTLYGYDEAGNVGEAAVHYRQPDGELKLGLLFVYLYYTDGNLYKQLTYTPVEGSEEYSLISTRTYENYSGTENPFPLEILPNVNSQPNLPGTYRVEENGHDILYQFFYEFDTNGKLVKRTTSSSSGNEVAIYQYY